MPDDIHDRINEIFSDLDKHNRIINSDMEAKPSVPQ